MRIQLTLLVSIYVFSSVYSYLDASYVSMYIGMYIKSGAYM